jgi:murein DD-endopeptidase MepM/ murein hydrolase activator NlpD
MSGTLHTLRRLPETEPDRHSWTGLVIALAAVAIAATLTGVAFAAVRGDQARLAAQFPAPVMSPVSLPKPHPFRPSDRLAWPDHGKVTGRFGELRAGHRHAGIDIPMPAGTPIRAAAPGRVILRAAEQGYGKYTCIAHRTVTTCYGHQSRFHTRLGARVRRGQVIGYVGNTGDTSAYHVHFEVRRGTRPWGTPVNPLKFLRR